MNYFHNGLAIRLRMRLRRKGSLTLDDISTFNSISASLVNQDRTSIAAGTSAITPTIVDAGKSEIECVWPAAQTGSIVPGLYYVDVTAVIGGEATPYEPELINIESNGGALTPLPGVEVVLTPPSLVFIGSSVTAGLGATGIEATPANQGWANRLGVLMTNRGWSVSNLAKSGSAVTTRQTYLGEELLSQMEVLDVALADKPTVVIFGASLGTATLQGSSDPEYAVRVLVEQVREVIRRCHQAGSICIIGGVFPRGNNGTVAGIGWTSTEYRWALYANHALANLCVPYIDWMRSLDANLGIGSYVAAYTADAIHPNDSGYDVMYRCCDPTWIDSARMFELPRAPVFGTRTVFRVCDVGGDDLDGAVDAVTSPPLILKFSSSSSNTGAYDLFVQSFTFSCWIQIPTANHVNKRLVAFPLSVDTILRLRVSSGGILELVNTAGGGLVSSSINPVTTRAWHHAVVIHDHVTGTVRLYIDGVDLGNASLPGGANQTIQRIDVGCSADGLGPSEGYQFCGINAFRGVKSADQVRALYRGDTDVGSAIVSVDQPGNLWAGVANLAGGRAVATPNLTPVTDIVAGLTTVVRLESVT